MPKFITYNETETMNLGLHFARRRLRPGTVVALFGDLGSGKTRFVKGICMGLGVREHVGSPSFTIVNEYSGDEGVVYHFDFYRVNSRDEIAALGFDDYLQRKGVCVIEWAERATDLLPDQRFDVKFLLRTNEQEREIDIIEHGAKNS